MTARAGRRWWRSRRGVAALEMALLAPALVTVALTLYDVCEAVAAWWQMASAAHAIGLIATNLAATPALTNVLSATDAATASTAVYAVRPSLASAPPGQFGVTLSSVVFTASPTGCGGAGCTYAAHVAWSVTLQGNAPARPCGTLAVAADTARPSPMTLPTSAFSASPILLVDVFLQYQPLLTTPFAARFPLRESAYFAPRTGADSAWVRYTGANAAQVQCPGYTG